jgi:hypothetical protein
MEPKEKTEKKPTNLTEEDRRKGGKNAAEKGVRDDRGRFVKRIKK